MGGFFSPPPAAPPQIVIPPAPPKAPQIDDAISRRNQEDQNAIKSYGRGSTLLTGTRGLSDLGSVGAPAAGGRGGK